MRKQVNSYCILFNVSDIFITKKYLTFALNCYIIIDTFWKRRKTND